jgi:hypothetical protein
MTSNEPLVERLDSLEELRELRRNTLRYARGLSAGKRAQSSPAGRRPASHAFQGPKMAADPHA